MVFSRYVTVFRAAGKSFRSNLLQSKVKPETPFTKTSFTRTCSTQEKRTEEIPSNSSKPLESVLFRDGKKCEREISHFSSKPAIAVAKISSVIKERSSIDSFGSQFFTSNDVVPDNYEVELEEGPLDTCDEDVSHITPNFVPTFNFAAYAESSPVIQELAKLGVELYKLEGNRRHMEVILQRNFSDMQPYIRLLHDAGVPADGIGAFITKNPEIFTQNIDDLHTRIRYLRAHSYTVEMIARIVSVNPFWLMFSTKRIDTRLGYFQQQFHLNGYNVRYLSTKQPRLITYSLAHIRENIFAVKEEMGFNMEEMKSILLSQPRLFMKSRKPIVEVFDYLHNTMKIPHGIICSKPGVLTCRLQRLQTRHRYLETLGKNQYDPKKPLYISLEALVSGSDTDFCTNVAKTTVVTYNLFQKTL